MARGRVKRAARAAAGYARRGRAMEHVKTIEDVQRLLAEEGYVCGRALATALFLALRLGRPLFLEGEPGTGKTEIAKAIAAALGRRLISLQCYEGLDSASAVAEWNFAAQMIALRAAEVGKLGFEQVIVPRSNRKGAKFPDGLKVTPVDRLGKALDAVL